MAPKAKLSRKTATRINLLRDQVYICRYKSNNLPSLNASTLLLHFTIERPDRLELWRGSEIKST